MINAQNDLSFVINKIDTEIQISINKGEYDNGWLVAYDYAEKMKSSGNKEEALKYYLICGDIYDKYRDYMLNHGCTIEGYYAYWVNVAFLCRDLNQIPKALKIYNNIIPRMHEEAPHLIPKFTPCYFVILSENNCENINIKSEFEKSVNTIISGNFVYDEIDYLNQINEDYIYYLLKNKQIEEGPIWFEKYNYFYNNLDSKEYRKPIIDYYRNYAYCLDLCRMNAENENRYSDAITYLTQEIKQLNNIINESDTIPIKIASCNVNIGKDFYYLGNLIESKKYTDKAYEYMFNFKDNIDYCRVINGLALNFWNLNQPENAAIFKKIELQIRERTDLKPSISDYGLLMMYNQNDTIDNIMIGLSFDAEHDYNELYMDNIYIYLADAISKNMHKKKKCGNDIQEDLTLFNEYINKAKQNIETNIEWYTKMNQNARNNKYYKLNITLGSHYRRFNELDSAIYYYKKALNYSPDSEKTYLALIGCYKKDKSVISQFLPAFYYNNAEDIKKMLPLLGTVEGSIYLMNGTHNIYRFPEFAVWNPDDSLCTSIAYNSVLLSKGIYMEYSSFASAIGEDGELDDEFKKLNKLKNSIYEIKDENTRILALHDYEIKERELREQIKKTDLDKSFVEWKDIQNLLGDNEVAVEFIEYEQNNYDWLNEPINYHYIALLIDKYHNHPIVVDLFDSEFIKKIYDFQPKSYDSEIGNLFFDNLWGKLNNYIKDAKIIYYSPMGLMSLINIESIKNKSGKTANDIYNLRRLSSTKDILNENDNNEIYNVVLFGGINYTLKNSERKFELDSLNTRGNWNFLNNTKNEINEIEKSLASTSNVKLNSYSSFNATESVFKSLSSNNPDIIHIATHGFYIPEDKRKNIPYYNYESDYSLTDNLFYSGLVMAGGQDAWNNDTFKLNADDGILTSYEISQMNLHKTSLVVLSACETGVGDRDFDGIVGLQRAFKMAGVQTIIMSLWKVDDEATSLLMTAFYKELLRTGSKHDAFVYAQKIVREKYDDPYFWASFVMLD